MYVCSITNISFDSLTNLRWSDGTFKNFHNLKNFCRRCKQRSKLLCKLHLFKNNTIRTLASWASRFDYQPIRAARSTPSSPDSGFFSTFSAARVLVLLDSFPLRAQASLLCYYPFSPKCCLTRKKHLPPHPTVLVPDLERTWRKEPDVWIVDTTDHSLPH